MSEELENGDGVNDIVTVGRLVEVASRTWPGINQPGGVARVTQVYFQKDTNNDKDETVDKDKEGGPTYASPTHVDVSYMVGRSKEKRVPIEYVTLAPQYETHQSRGNENSGGTNQNKSTRKQSSLRDRSLLLGRCRRCGSLRTDCGSCDWASENVNELSTATEKPASLPRKRSPRQRTLVDSSDDDSSSDDDDDIALRELIRKSKNQYRKHVRSRRKWDKLITSKLEAKRTESTNTREDMNINQDSDEEEDLEELWQNSQQRYRRHKQQHSKWERRLQRAATTRRSQSKGSRSFKQHRSVLETVATANTQSGQKSTGLATKTKDKKRRRITLDPMPEEENGRRNNEVDTDDGLRTPQKPSRGMNVDENSPIGIPDSSSPESMGIPFAVDSPEEERTHPSYTLDPRRISDYNALDPTDDLVANDTNFAGETSNTLALSDFIQPEGEEAAENLPEDMIDRTKDIAYTELPSFFDNTASDLEDRILPDFRLRLAELQRQFRRLRGSASTSESQTITSILQACQQLWKDVTHSMIRNGTDQCKAALRTMSDNKIYRKHRSSLTPIQRKRIRGTTIMDARNLRLDALEEAVEDLVRNLKELTLSCEDEQSSFERRDVDMGAETSSGEESIPDYQLTQDLIPMNLDASEDIVPDLDPCERDLGEFDPHQHATRKSTKSSSSDRSIREQKSHSEKPGENTDKRSKRARESGPLGGFIVEDESYRKHCRAKQKSNKRSHNVSRNSGGKTSGSMNVRFTNGADNGSSTARLEGPTVDLVAPMGSDDTAHSLDGTPGATTSPQVSKRRRRKKSTNANYESSTSLHHERSGFARDRIPISQRMQAFLDKNRELEFGEQEEAEVPTFRDSVVTNTNMIVGDKRQKHRSTNTTSERQQNRRVNNGDGRPPQLVQQDLPPEIREREEDEAEISTDFLLSRYEEAKSSKISSLSPTLGVNVPSIAAELQQSYPHDHTRSVWLLERAGSMLPELDDAEKRNISCAALDLLQEHGSAILTEFIAIQSPLLKSHVSLLAFLVQADNFLSRHCWKPDLFLKYVVLQMVDALYALFHLEAWSLKISDRRRILLELEPLRDALSRRLHLVEAVSRCLLEQLGSQEWRLSSGSDVLYVSSLESQKWKAFLQSGSESNESTIFSNNPKESRLQKFSDVFPRVEVEVLWKILLFVGSSRSVSECKTQARWQLIGKMFMSSVLAKSPDSALPPCREHLLALGEEIQNVDHLLRMQSLNEVPSSDTLLVNLIKKAVAMQSDDYRGNEESRLLSYPGCQIQEDEIRSTSRLWKATFNLLPVEPSLIHEKSIKAESISFASTDGNKGFKMKHLLHSKSDLLGGCASVLLQWSHKVPTKKVREMRFLKQLKALRSAFDELKSPLPTTTQGHQDAFSAAFQTEPPVEIGEAKERADFFLQEASATLFLVESISLGSAKAAGLTVAKMKEIWELIAPEKLKKCRDDITQSHFDQVKVSPFQCYVVARMMTCVAFLSLGLSPWDISCGLKRTKIELNIDEHRGMIDYHSFPISCVFASLECLFQNGAHDPLLLRVLSMVTLVFNQMTIFLKVDGIHPSLNRVSTEALEVYVPILVRCLRKQLNKEGVSVVDNSVLISLLTSLRAVWTFQSMRLARHVAQPDNAPNTAISSSHDEDEFSDEFDLSLFQSVDLEIPRPHATKVDGSDRTPFKYLVDILNDLKPSKRFEVFSSRRAQTDSMTSQGRHIMSLEVDKLCDCVAVAAAAHPYDSSKAIWDELMRSMQLSCENSSDAEFNARVFQRVSLGVCSLAAQSMSCQQFISANADIFIGGVIQSMFDPDRVQFYPSCDMEFIESNGGEAVAREIISELAIINDERTPSHHEMSTEDFDRLFNKKARKLEKARAPWDAAKNLSKALSPTLPSLSLMLGLVNADLQVQFEDSFSGNSLERESFDCFQLMRGVISKTARTNSDLFCKISSLLLSSLASQLLRIVQSLRYQDQQYSTQDEDADISLRRVRTGALFKVFSELFVALSAWIVRETPSCDSASLSTLTKDIMSRVIYPILRRQFTEMTSNLRHLASSCRLKINSAFVSTEAAIPGCAQYFEGFFETVLRRARCFVMAECMQSQSHTLLSCFMEAVSHTANDREVLVATLLGRAFSPRNLGQGIHKGGPLGQEIDWYLSHVEAEHVDEEVSKRIEARRIDFLEGNVIPRIGQQHGSIHVKRKLMRVAGHVVLHLKTVQHTTSRLCALARAARITVTQASDASEIDDTLVEVVFSCFKGLATLKTRAEPSQTTLLNWCHENAANVKWSDIENLERSKSESLFLYCCFRWLCELGRIVAFELETNTASDSFRSLANIRNELELDDIVWSRLVNSDIDASCGDETSMQHWYVAMQQLELQVLYTRLPKQSTIVNRYAKTTSVATVEEWKDWKPSNASKRAAKDFVATVLSLT